MKTKSKFIPLILMVIVLSGCDHFEDMTEVTSRIVDFNIWDFLMTFTAFIVLLLIVFYLGYKPVKEAIQKRKEYVENNIKVAEDRELKSRTLVDEATSTLETSKKEALKIVEDSKEVALKEKEKILLEAKEEAKLEKEKAKQEIIQEIEAQKDLIHKEIVDVALTASEELLSREVTSEDNKRLLDDFISDLENKEDK